MLIFIGQQKKEDPSVLLNYRLFVTVTHHKRICHVLKSDTELSSFFCCPIKMSVIIAVLIIQVILELCFPANTSISNYITLYNMDFD